jgi:choline dehydrogenase-like flavoprotein
MAAIEDQGYESIDEHNGKFMIGPTLNTMTIVNNQRMSMADAYLAPILPRNNLEVLDQCLVDKLLFDKYNRCIGVTYIRHNKEHHIYADNGVILCAGTIGSPQILLRSGIGAADQLEALCIKPRVNLTGVGKNLQDHCLGAGNVYHARRSLPQSKYQHSESLFYLNSEDTTPAPDLVLACVTLPVVTEQFEMPNIDSAYTLLYGVTSPESRGFLRLQSLDPYARPIIDPRYLSASKDRDRFLEALDFARDLGASKMFAEWRGKEHLPGHEVKSEASRRDFNRAAAYTHHHPVGTCCMGINNNAVISPNLSVYGTENLFIVDGSIMPTITTGPTNAVIVAIAEKASDILLKRPLLTPTYI